MSCNPDPNDPERIINPAASIQSSATGSEALPSTDCVSVIISGKGGDDLGGGGGGGGGGGIGGISIGTQPPGTAPGDAGSQVGCFAAAYRSWEIMDKYCQREPTVQGRLSCNEVNMRLYSEEQAYCRTLR